MLRHGDQQVYFDLINAPPPETALGNQGHHGQFQAGGGNRLTACYSRFSKLLLFLGKLPANQLKLPGLNLFFGVSV
jgi:hypothetical protein